MRVFGLWWGGSSYGQGHLDRDLEEFESVEHAKKVFYSRRYGIHPQSTFYVERENSPVGFPAVDEDSVMWLYYRDPRGEHDPYPDVRLTFGPRGGIKSDRC